MKQDIELLIWFAKQNGTISYDYNNNAIVFKVKDYYAACSILDYNSNIFNEYFNPMILALKKEVSSNE